MGTQTQEGEKRLTICIKIKKAVNLFSKLNIESKHINAVNRIKHYHNTLIILYFCQYLDKKVATSCPEFSAIFKILPLYTNHGGALGWLST